MIVEARYLKSYDADEPYVKYMDIEVVEVLYGTNVLSADTLTLVDYNTSCDIGLYFWSTMGDKFVFKFDALEVKDDANFPVFNLDICTISYLRMKENSLIGLFVYDYPYLKKDTVNYVSFKEDMFGVCDQIQSATSTQEIPSGYSTFPNPVQQTLNIEMKDNKKSEYKIYSSTGSLITSGKIESQNRYSVDMSTFTSGVYYLQMQVGEEVFTEKLLKI